MTKSQPDRNLPARPITQGKANTVATPEWLVLALAEFQDFVGGEITSEEARGFAKIIEQMHDAAGKLITWLPAF